MLRPCVNTALSLNFKNSKFFPICPGAPRLLALIQSRTRRPSNKNYFTRKKGKLCFLNVFFQNLKQINMIRIFKLQTIFFTLFSWASALFHRSLISILNLISKNISKKFLLTYFLKIQLLCDGNCRKQAISHHLGTFFSWIF